MTKNEKNYKEIAEMASSLKSIATISEETCRKLFGVSKDDAIKNMLNELMSAVR